jgi:glycosyltransferase involved in cell wall biosynthesis
MDSYNPQPLVSVVMITYNHARYIERAIKSVLGQQTAFPFELVIGEDQSTDGTREIVLDYQKKYPETIRVVTDAVNVGMHKNYYRVEQACRGKYLAYCEGDDFMHHPQKLQKQADYLESHPACGLVYSDHDRFYEHTGKTISSFYRTTGQVPPQDYNLFRGWGGYHILTCTVMLRKCLIDQVTQDRYLYQENTRPGGTDIPRFIEVSLLSSNHYMEESLSTYTVCVNSASNMQDVVKRARFFLSNAETYRYLAQKHGYKTEYDHFTKVRRLACLKVAFLEQNRELAERIASLEGPLTVKERALYWSTKNAAAYAFLYRLYRFWIACKKYRRENPLKKSLP